ncbi:MAG: pentapeptide repeat-containing protein, partial [Ardenticatenaceae bacterium]
KECNGSMAQFRFSKLKDARFQNCDLREADFYATHLNHVAFRNCDLRGADFSAAQLTDVDLRGCKIEGMNISPNAVRGITIEPQQAIHLARILGATVSTLKKQD